ESARGDGRFAFRSVRFRNPTASTLETGPVTVYGEGRFIGEGLTESIAPHAMAVVPFALDRQVVVERDETAGDRIARLTRLSRGILTCDVRHTRTTRLKITNRQSAPAIVLVRHTVPKGWTLGKGVAAAEKYGEAHLFRIELLAGQSRTIEIEESTPMPRTLDL